MNAFEETSARAFLSYHGACHTHPAHACTWWSWSRSSLFWAPERPGRTRRGIASRASSRTSMSRTGGSPVARRASRPGSRGLSGSTVLHGGRQDGVDDPTRPRQRPRDYHAGAHARHGHPARRDGRFRDWAGSSPVAESSTPRYVDLQARGGLGWLEGFNEWMVRCGLEWAGHPGRDRFVNNVGEQGRDGPDASRESGEHPGVRGRSGDRSRAAPRASACAAGWTSECSTVPSSSSGRRSPPSLAPRPFASRTC